MIRVNLIPRDRIQGKRHRTRTRRWITACAGYALFLLVSFVVSNVVASGDDRSLRAELEAATIEKEDNDQAILTLRGDLLQASEALEANLAVGNQPDWGVLLALLADITGEEIVLRHFRAGHQLDSQRTSRSGDRNGSPVLPADTEAASTIIELSGLGRSQEHVSSFLLRMEQVPLFRQVKLHDTKREPFLDDYAVGFRLECALATDGGATQP